MNDGKTVRLQHLKTRRQLEDPQTDEPPENCTLDPHPHLAKSPNFLLVPNRPLYRDFRCSSVRCGAKSCAIGAQSEVQTEWPQFRLTHSTRYRVLIVTNNFVQEENLVTLENLLNGDGDPKCKRLECSRLRDFKCCRRTVVPSFTNSYGSSSLYIAACSDINGQFEKSN